MWDIKPEQAHIYFPKFAKCLGYQFLAVQFIAGFWIMLILSLNRFIIKVEFHLPDFDGVKKQLQSVRPAGSKFLRLTLSCRQRHLNVV